MSFFDLFRRKPKPANTEKSPAQNIVPVETSKLTKSNLSSYIKVTSEIIPSIAEEVIPAEKRIKDAIASKHGLYPHEVLVLDYAGSYYMEGNSFQGFWWYRYGVRDVDKCLRSLR